MMKFGELNKFRYWYWNGLPYAIGLLSCHVCLSCLWRWCTVAKRLDGIKMKLGAWVGLGPGHTVLDGDPAPTTERGTASPTCKIYGCRLCLRPCNLRSMSVVAKWLDGSRCHLAGGRPWCRPHCVRWGRSCPSPKGAQPSSPPIFGPCMLWPNGWMHQDATW